MRTSLENDDISVAYKFLLGPHRKKQEINRLEATIGELRSCLLPGAIRYDKDSVQTSPKNQQEETIIKIADLEQKLEVIKDERAAMIIKVCEAIDKLDNPVERAVLTYYYIRRERLDKTASCVGYSIRHLLRIKKSGVGHLAEILSLNVT